MMKWLQALLSETVFSVWWILSALSTLSTFVVPGLSGKWRLVSAISAGLGFAWANYRVFQKQERQISALSAAVGSHEARASHLRITPDNGSRYILVPVGNQRNADFNGGYLETRLMIENTGRRNSIVNSYQVEIVQLQETFPNLQPQEGRNGIQGRHCQHGLQPTQILSRTGVVRIDAESATDHGSLLFFIPGIALKRFADAGLRMHGEQRKFDPLRCRLTLTDTTNSSATGEFELHED